MSNEKTVVIAATPSRARHHIRTEGLIDAEPLTSDSMLRGATNTHFIFVGPWRNRKGAEVIERHVVVAVAFGNCRVTHVNQSEAVHYEY